MRCSSNQYLENDQKFSDFAKNNPKEQLKIFKLLLMNHIHETQKNDVLGINT